MKRVLIVAFSISALALAVFLLVWTRTSTRTETQYFSIELPSGWSIKPLAPLPDEDSYVDFEVLSPESKQVLVVSAATDGPQFIQCFCAPWENYRQYERDGIKYADLTMTVGKSRVRTLKAVGTQFGTDVHLEYGAFDKPTLDRIVESVRPF